MKTGSVIVAAVAVCALGLAGYLYWQSGPLRKDLGVCRDQRDGLLKDKARLEAELSSADSQLSRISHSAAALKIGLNSFMFAGDVRALTVGSRESTQVEQAIGNLDNSQDRMTAERDWGDFKNTRYLNPLIGFLRNLVYGIERDAVTLPPVR